METFRPQGLCPWEPFPKLRECAALSCLHFSSLMKKTPLWWKCQPPGGVLAQSWAQLGRKKRGRQAEIKRGSRRKPMSGTLGVNSSWHFLNPQVTKHCPRTRKQRADRGPIRGWAQQPLLWSSPILPAHAIHKAGSVTKGWGGVWFGPQDGPGRPGLWMTRQI